MKVKKELGRANQLTGFYMIGTLVAIGLINMFPTFKGSHPRCSIKKLFFKFRYINRKTPVLESLFNKVADPKACNLIKKESNTGVLM